MLDQKVLKSLAEQNETSQELEAQANRQEIAGASNAEKQVVLRTSVLAASQNLQSLDSTMHGFERTLQPIHDMHLTYLVKLPLDDPALKQYKDLLQAEYAKQIADPNEADPPFESIGNAGDGNQELQIQPGSDLYPDRGSIVGACLIYYVLELHFYKDEGAAAQFLKQPWPVHDAANLIVDADLSGVLDVPPLVPVTEIHERRPNLLYSSKTNCLYAEYLDVPTTNSLFEHTVRRIESIPDMLGCYVDATRNGEASGPTTEPCDGLAQLHLQTECSLQALCITVSGEYFVIEPTQIKHNPLSNDGDAAEFEIGRDAGTRADADSMADFLL